jgi:subtilase family serine protease
MSAAQLQIASQRVIQMIGKPAACFVALLIGGFLLNSPALGQPSPALTHHLREAVANGQAQALGRLPATQSMQFDIVLPLRDRPGLQSFLSELYDPAGPHPRHFLTPEEFTQRFGPSQEDWDALVAFAKASGFEIVSGSRDAMDLRLIGSVGSIERAFHVTMSVYQHPEENRTFLAPDREPTADLPFQLWHISGLDNYSIPQPALVNKYDYAEAHGLNAEDVSPAANTGSGPSQSFLGSDMRAAYCGSACALFTGTNQTIALFEFAGYDIADLNTYYTNVKQTRTAAVKGISADGTSLTCLKSKKCGDVEQIIDMTQALGMAPGIKTLYVYVGSTDTAIISAMTVATDAPLSNQISCSWFWHPADPSTLAPYFERMAAQGQTFFTASGDNGSWSPTNHDFPANDANVVAVGGTVLTTASAGGPWASETAWSNSGGGLSQDGAGIPLWQEISGVIDASNGGSKTLRNGPDVSANANWSFYVCANQTTCTANVWGGTSFAAPMWAGFMALVNQYAAIVGESTIGFLDPPLYDHIGTGANYHTDMHDITVGSNGGFSAVSGFDLVTGWGSPVGINLIPDLAIAGACGYGRPGEILHSGNSVNSCDGRFTLTMQTSDGNLVLSWKGHGSLWSSKTAGNPLAYAVMQDDGNFVVYSKAKKALWNSKTAKNPGSYFELQNDGNLVVYNPDRIALWSSHTCCR